MLIIFRESETELVSVTVNLHQPNHSARTVGCRSFHLHLGRACVITSRCHAEEEKAGSLFLKSDVCEEWMPKL